MPRAVIFDSSLKTRRRVGATWARPAGRPSGRMFDWFWNMLSAMGFGNKEARILILGAYPISFVDAIVDARRAD